MPPPSPSPHLGHEAQIQISQQSKKQPSTSLQHPTNHTNTQGPLLEHSSLFNPNFAPEQLPFQQDSGSILQQSLHSILWITTKIRLKRFISVFPRLASEVREITIGNGSFSIKWNTGHIEDSCYVQYIPSRKRWRATPYTSDIPLRLVQESELTHGCQQLISIAGCSFKTPNDTLRQCNQPLEIPSRSLRNVMQSLGFCIADSSTLYRVYSPRIRRPIKVGVIVVPMVDENGRNQGDDNDMDVQGLLLARVSVVENEDVTGVVHRLKLQTRNSVVTEDGREVVKKKLRGRNSVLLV